MAHEPGFRRRLGVGVPTWAGRDDGGLVDVNIASAAVIAQVGDIDPSHAKAIAAGGEARGAVVEFITAVRPAPNPLRLSKAPSGESEGLPGARRGDNRALIEVDEATRTILVVRMAHRADAYQPTPPAT